MAPRDSVRLPKSVSRLKIAQTALAIFVLGLTAYLEFYYTGEYQILVPLTTAGFTLLIIIYYCIALSGSQKFYSWILLFLLECIAVVSWIASTVLAALLCRRIVHKWHSEDGDDDDDDNDEGGEYPRFKRDADDSDEYEDYNGIPILSYVSTSSAIVGLCAIQLILYGFTLVLMLVHRNHKAITPSYDYVKDY